MNDCRQEMPMRLRRGTKKDFRGKNTGVQIWESKFVKSTEGCIRSKSEVAIGINSLKKKFPGPEQKAVSTSGRIANCKSQLLQVFKLLRLLLAKRY